MSQSTITQMGSERELYFLLCGGSSPKAGMVSSPATVTEIELRQYSTGLQVLLSFLRAWLGTSPLLSVAQ